MRSATEDAKLHTYDNQFEKLSDAWFKYDSEFDAELNRQLAVIRDKNTTLQDLLAEHYDD